MNLLQISHPSVLDWRTVEEIVSDDPAEYISHPSFPTSVGLLVRLKSPERAFDRVLYAGIYGESSCVDVSVNSRFMVGISTLAAEVDHAEDFITLWSTTIYSDWMMSLISPYLSGHEKIDIMCDIVQRFIPHTGGYEIFYQKMIYNLRHRIHDERLYDDFRNLSLRDNNFYMERPMRYLVSACGKQREIPSLDSCAHHTARSMASEYYTLDNEGHAPAYRRHLASIAYDLRRKISFYDICVRITQTPQVY